MMYICNSPQKLLVVAKHRKTPQNAAICRNSPQNAVKRRNSPQNAANGRNSLQFAAKNRNSPQNAARRCNSPQNAPIRRKKLQFTAKCKSTFKQIARFQLTNLFKGGLTFCCNSLQNVSPPLNKLVNWNLAIFPIPKKFHHLHLPHMIFLQFAAKSRNSP